MKNGIKKLLSFLMVFALFGGLFYGVNTVNAQEADETVITPREYARRVSVNKTIYYNNKVAGTATCNVAFTYDLPTGKPLVSPISTSTVGSNGYTLTVSVKSTNSGKQNPASIVYNYTVKSGNSSVSSGTFTVYFYNNGNYN